MTKKKKQALSQNSKKQPTDYNKTGRLEKIIIWIIIGVGLYLIIRYASGGYDWYPGMPYEFLK